MQCVPHVAVADLRTKCTLVEALALFVSRHSIAVVADAAAVADKLEAYSSFQPHHLLERLSDWRVQRIPRGKVT